MAIGMPPNLTTSGQGAEHAVPENDIRVRPCVTCQTKHNNAYCPNCGQKRLGRISNAMVFEAVTDVFDLDKGILRTALDLVLRPGKVVHTYWMGNTRTYTNPLRLLALILAISTYLATFMVDELMRQIGRDPDLKIGNAERSQQIIKEIGDILSNGNIMSIANLMFLPLFGLALYQLFKYLRLTYAEHLVAFTYIQAGSSAIVLPYTLICLLISQQNSDLGFLLQAGTGVISLIYIPYAFGQVYGSPGKRWGAIARGLLSFWLVSGVISGIVAGAYLLWMGI